MVLGVHIAECDNTAFRDIILPWQREQDETVCQGYRQHHLEDIVAIIYLMKVKGESFGQSVSPSALYWCL